MTAISALMLTTPDRWFFTGLAIESWLAQKNRQDEDELVIISEDWLEIAPHSGVRFVKTAFSETLAEKRNIGVSACRNPWVLFWDDDDWHAPERLKATREVATRPVCYRHIKGDDRSPLLIHEPPQIVGQREALFHELIGERRTFLYRYPVANMRTDPFFVGGTLAFRKRLWEEHPFVELESPGDEGWWMVARMRDGAVPHAPIVRRDATTYVAMIHGKNTCATEPRVNAHGQVLSNSFMMMLTSDPAAQLRLCIPDEQLARYEAAIYAQSGERE